MTASAGIGFPVVYLLLLAAITSEVIATSALQASQQFTRFWPSVLVVLFYASAFYFLSHVLRYMPVGVAYAIWSGLGIVMITLIGLLLFRQTLDWPAVVGLGLIIAGVLVINLFSKTIGH